MKQFAENLKAQLGSSAAPAAAPRVTPAGAAASPTTAGPVAPAAAPARPISGFSLMARVIWDAIVRLFGGRSGQA
jgi:hypothetical protein